MAKLVREKATSEADLPHKFAERAEAPSLICSVCQTGSQDPRHRAWEAQQLAEREQAQAQFQRETGS